MNRDEMTLEQIDAAYHWLAESLLPYRRTRPEVSNEEYVKEIVEKFKAHPDSLWQKRLHGEN